MTGKPQCSGAFLLMVGAAFLWGQTEYLCLFALAAGLHEWGHLLALRLLGGRAEAVCFRLSGMEIRYSGRLSYGAEGLLAAAGPAMNLAQAGLCRLLHSRWPLSQLAFLAGCHLCLALFNLLPALPLDGGRVAQALLCSRFPTWGQRLTEGLSAAVGILLLLGGICLLKRNQNLTLLVAAGVILSGLWRKNRKKAGEEP